MKNKPDNMVLFSMVSTVGKSLDVMVVNISFYEKVAEIAAKFI